MRNLPREGFEELYSQLPNVAKWRDWLERAVEDPGSLYDADAPEDLLDEPAAKNMAVDNVYERRRGSRTDAPPPRRTPELGIGREIAWQRL